MNKQEEKQVLVDAPAILMPILLDHGEQHAMSEVVRLVDVAESAIARAEAAEREVQKLTTMLNEQERLAQENAKEFDRVLAGADHGVMVAAGLYHQWRDAIERAEAAEAALMAATAEAYDYKLKLQDVVSGTAIGQLETDLAYYKAMVAAVPEYIKDLVDADLEVSPSLEEWFEGTIDVHDE